ncbi:MAG TPA: hypothetical protein DDY20_09225 [Desulfobulbaceae bacterium]|nr:hypothetical protein [Desulfobulbaceae bacterium]
MFNQIKQSVIRKIVRLFRTALHDAEVRGDLRIIASELLADPAVRGHARDMLQHALADPAFRTSLTETAAAVMADERVGGEMWKKCQLRPQSEDFSYAYIPNSIKDELFRMATRESARFAAENMSDVMGMATPFEVLSRCLDEAAVDGLYLEFGVYSGTTINFIASRVQAAVHGFDSFEGLPEQWGNVPAGKFTRHGDLPEVRENVSLHVGLFDKTLPGFLEAHAENAAFIHIDSDLYSSAKTVLALLRPRIVPGTVIVFDEFFNYPGWQEHECRAFLEFISASGLSFRYISYASRGFSVGVKIASPENSAELRPASILT